MNEARVWLFYSEIMQITSNATSYSALNLKHVNEFDTIAKEITWTMEKVSMYDSC